VDPIWIAVAFVFGFLAKQVSLPPLVGFLLAGFVLKVFGVEGGETLQQIADLGVTLLLFSIGLKLDVKGLLKPEVWGTASLHLVFTVVVFGGAFYGLSFAGVSLFAGLDLTTAAMIAFALSFSSTVFAVKALEERGEIPSIHGRVAIGILIVQDIAAVVFLTLSTGKIPSLWAFALFGLIFLRPLFYLVMDRCGHGELLPLFGLFAALVLGAGLFQLVGLKPDLGALILGVLLSGHAKSGEVSNALFAFKDIFLVGFFLTIGLAGVPTFESFSVALLLVAVVPLKAALFLVLLMKFRLRARSSLLGTLALATYSEFGLIVGAVGYANGWIAVEWIVVMAIALSITLVAGAPLNAAAFSIYERFHDALVRYQSPRRLRSDVVPDPDNARIAVIGMGRVGSGVYSYLREHYGDIVMGIENDRVKAEEHQKAGRHVVLGDASDYDFWERIHEAALRTGHSQIEMIFLAMPLHSLNIYAARQIHARGIECLTAAVAKYPDDAKELSEEGVDLVFNLYSEAGSGFAAHACEIFAERMDALRPAGTSE
jgi:predicted Kef-type K+ transport protein